MGEKLLCSHISPIGKFYYIVVFPVGNTTMGGKNYSTPPGVASNPARGIYFF